jgi:hypothetical protein
MSIIPTSLQSKINEFLPTIRIGVDFGEHAGGIAVVRENEILHGETFIDFHKADLEERRGARRGRRTRQAKRMRLARLRSWVLRQEIPRVIPGGVERGGKYLLPDPYIILNNKKFWVRPDTFQQEKKDPKQTVSWLDLAKNGDVDACGFVRALTLLFKKRGYKWDDRAVSEMNDMQLKGFLDHARIPSEATALRDEIMREIQRRTENPGDPVRGRKKVGPLELTALLEQACSRLSQPRVAEHRSVKEAELKAVVDGFGCSKLPPETLGRWKKELAALLNKVIRPARFDNRVRSGCAWCGKKTPRKAKVREIAYRAAIHNLRALTGGREGALPDEESRQFLDWYLDRKGAPGLATIKKRLLKLNYRQAGMANQIYDLLKNEHPKGRVSLCVPHLEMAAQGKTMKDAGVDWQTISTRNAPNPSREQHDARVLHRLEQIVFVKGKRGDEAWRHGPVTLISLEVPEPQTERAKKGQVPERKSQTFKERLLNEIAGRCIYCDQSATDRDHIFPRSYGGPDIWDNQIATCVNCNQTKGNRTPFEYLRGEPARWQEFKRRVNGLSLAPRKKQILLNESEEFPGGDPTPFARVGARPRQFVVALQKLFTNYGVEPPTLNYVTGRPHIQLVKGGLTNKLRESWQLNSQGEINFGEKERWDLYNHVQDAAIIAACPPHTWRDRIFIHHAIKPGMAVPEIAPDWIGFLQSRQHPTVRILGRYPISWKRSLFKETLWQEPANIQAKKGVVYMPVTRIAASVILKEGENEGIVSPFYREKLKQLVKKLRLEKLDTIPADELSRELPGVRRVKVFRQKVSGVWVSITPKDGPMRKMIVAPESASEGAVYWLNKDTDDELGISIIRPRTLGLFGVSRLDPPIPKGAKRLGAWRRHQMLWLGADSKNGCGEGWYRLKEFSAQDVKLLPENAMPTEIALRLHLKRNGSTEKGMFLKERKLGRREILKFWLERPRRNFRKPPPV